MIPTIFNINRRLNFKRRTQQDFVNHDFLHREVFLNHLERLSMMLQDMPSITFVDVPDYFLEFPETIAFFKLKKTTHVKNIIRESDMFPTDIRNQNAIVALLTCHSVNDVVGYFIQVKNALCEDGAFVASFFGEKTVTLLKNAVAQAELELTNACENRFYPIIDIRTIGGLLQRSGFALPVADTEDYTVHYKNLKNIFKDIRGMGESNCMVHYPTPLKKAGYLRVLDNLEKTVPTHTFAIDILTITGRSPSDVQQKPLKAGSAQVSLTKIL